MRKLLLAVLLLSLQAQGSVRFITQAGLDLGSYTKLQCGTGLTCSQTAGKVLVTNGLQTQVASTTVTLTAAQCGSTIVSDSADVVTLPEASTVKGCRFTFVCAVSGNMDVNPFDGTDTILNFNYAASTSTATLAPSAGDAVRCGAAGASLVLEAVGNDAWAAIGTATGTWSDVN